MKLSKKIAGALVTGSNRVFGKPLWDLGSPLHTFGFTSVAAYNPNGSEPLTLLADMPDSTLLATYVDPSILALMGMSQDKIDPSTINVPLRDVRVISDLAGSQRIAIKGSSQVTDPTQPVQCEPSGPITLGDWRQARGEATVKCSDTWSAITLEFRGLIPNRLYTVCGMFNSDGRLASAPLGGAPNAFLTDGKGNAMFERVLNFCPLQHAPGQPSLLYLEIIFHSDQMVYGLVPDLTLTGLMGGVISHSQFEFPFEVTPAKPGEGSKVQ